MNRSKKPSDFKIGQYFSGLGTNITTPKSTRPKP